MADAAGALDVLSLGLGIGSSAAAVLAAAFGAWKLGVRAWNATVGRRHAQAEILDQLACTVSQVFVEKLLGVPKFTLGEEHIYALPGAWVAIQFKDAAVYVISITITDPGMWYRTGGMTIGAIDLRLGEDTFAEAGNLHDGEHLWMGNKQSGYYRHYHFGGAGGGHQHFWLSFNAVGAGMFDFADGPYASGIYESPFHNGDVAPDPAKITVNTITVLSPTGSINDVGDRELFGPHTETINLSPSEQKVMKAAAHKRSSWLCSLSLRSARSHRQLGR